MRKLKKVLSILFLVFLLGTLIPLPVLAEDVVIRQEDGSLIIRSDTGTLQAGEQSQSRQDTENWHVIRRPETSSTVTYSTVPYATDQSGTQSAVPQTQSVFPQTQGIMVQQEAAFASSSACTSHSCDPETGRCYSCKGLIVAVSDQGAYYTSLQEALNAGGTVRLMQDVIPSVASTLTVPQNVTVTLDLRGNKVGGGDLSVPVDIVNFGSFTLTDSWDDEGELFGSVYTEGYEIRVYSQDGTYEVTDCAYGAETLISGGRIFGDAVVCHVPEHSYNTSAEKPNPSLKISGGIFVGGTVCLLNENQGTVTITGGRYTVEPPEKHLATGYETVNEDGYYRVKAKQYFAGWIGSTLLTDPGLSQHAKLVLNEDTACRDYAAGDMDLVNVSSLMTGYGIVFDPDTDSLKCGLNILCGAAESVGSGANEKITGMSFTFTPVFYVFRGGESMPISMSWDLITDESMTVRLPVDAGLSCSTMRVYVGDAAAAMYTALPVQSDDSGNRYLQACFSAADLEAGLRYEAVIQDTCIISFEGNGGTLDADGTELRSVTSTVKGTEDLTLRENCFTKEHYVFSGWKNNGRIYAAGSEITFVTNDMVFTAVWVPEKYAVTYVLDGGENSILNMPYYEYGSTTVLEEAEKEEAVFAGWYDNENFEGEPVTALLPGTEGDQTLYARWNILLTVIISGDGTGTVADNERIYETGDQTELPSGGSFTVNLFHGDGSCISAVKVNGEDISFTSLLTLEELERNTELEIVFSIAATGAAQTVDLSGAGAADGSDLDERFRLRAEEAFGSDAILSFEREDALSALDMEAMKAAFTDATGQTIEENDEVAVQIRMKVTAVHTKENRIDGYTFDAEPVMTVLGADGTVKGSIAVPNDAILDRLTMRIPVDSLAYMDDAVVYHEGSLYGYIKIGGTSPERYVEVKVKSFSEYTVLVVDGASNHPAAAIGRIGYETVADAMKYAVEGDTVHILLPDAVYTAGQVMLNGVPMTLREALAAYTEGDELLCGNIRLAVGYDQLLVSAAALTFNAGPCKVVYHGNGGTKETGDPEQLELNAQTTVLGNDDADLNFKHPDETDGAKFRIWNTQPDGSGDYYGAGDDLPAMTEGQLDLYAIWYVATVYDWSGNWVGQYYTLTEAINQAKARQQVVLLYNVDDPADAPTITKELLLDLNGWEWVRNGVSFSKVDDAGKITNGFYSASADFGILKCIEYGENAYTTYQFRRTYQIYYNLGSSTSATVKGSATISKQVGETTTWVEKESNYLDSDRVYKNSSVSYIPTKTRSNGVDTSPKSATFVGWYFDSGLTSTGLGDARINNSGTFTMTNVSLTNCTLKAVSAPGWPTVTKEDGSYDTYITLYPKWMWNIIVAFNNYGYVTCDDVSITSGTPYYFDEGAKPLFKFVPNSGYHVYRVTIKGRSYGETYKGEIYSYTPYWYEKYTGEETATDKGLQISQTIVVTFARGDYNPETGDDGTVGLWMSLMAVSMICAATAALRLRKRKEGS